MTIAWAADPRITSTELLVDLAGTRYRGEYVLRDGKVFVFFAGAIYGEEQCDDEAQATAIATRVLRTGLKLRMGAKAEVARAPNNRRVKRPSRPTDAHRNPQGSASGAGNSFAMFRELTLGAAPSAYCRYCQGERSIDVQRRDGSLILRCVECDTQEEQ